MAWCMSGGCLVHSATTTRRGLHSHVQSASVRLSSVGETIGLTWLYSSVRGVLYPLGVPSPRLAELYPGARTKFSVLDTLG